MKTLIIRVPLVDTNLPAIPLDKRVDDLCNIEDAAGYKLVGFTTINSGDLLFLFQKPLPDE